MDYKYTYTEIAGAEQTTVYIDNQGYKCSKDGRIYRIVYYHYFPATDKKWHIHHIDHNKLNNKIDNLIALPEPVHAKVHNKAKQIGRYLTRLECEQYMELYTITLQEITKTEKEIEKMELKLKNLKRNFSQFGKK